MNPPVDAELAAGDAAELAGAAVLPVPSDGPPAVPANGMFGSDDCKELPVGNPLVDADPAVG
ncbi:MAG: hypothetical protein Aurels2KO_19130 [Aureliella sp.]